MSLRFVRKDARKVPDHWHTFGARGSLLANGPRAATNPANALLNYLYAILAGETHIGIITMGMDPGIGMLHTDQPSKDALVYDVMETARPEMDRVLYRFMESQVFRAGDFLERGDGAVRLSVACDRRCQRTPH